jgi:flagellar biosynthetic protein FlhB
MSERTEAPTGKRLGEARRRGQVARSAEVNAAAAMLAGLWLLSGPGRGLVDVLRDQLVYSLTHLPTGEYSGAQFRSLLAEAALRLAPGMGLLLAGFLATGVVASVAQTGLLWVSDRPFFDLNRVNPLNGLKRLFSGQGVMELGKALLKLLVVGGLAYSYWSGHTAEVLALGQMALANAAAHAIRLALGLGWQIGGAYLVLAAADYAYQRWTLNRSLKMTKEEVKEEAKTQEGDPLLKGRIRQQQRRFARQRMLAKVPKADVVITNPTHFAVALKYERDSMRAPQVVAKGAALVALRIRTAALENNVPVVENPPLARALYRAVELDQEVPPELYRAVAEVLAFVFRLKTQARPPAPVAVN